MSQSANPNTPENLEQAAEACGHDDAGCERPVVERTGDANVPTAAEGTLDQDARSTPAA